MSDRPDVEPQLRFPGTTSPATAVVVGSSWLTPSMAVAGMLILSGVALSQTRPRAAA